MTDASALLAVRDLRIEIESARGTVVPTDDVSYTIGRGEVVGLVGESGCGKTITSLATIGLLPSHARVAAGSIKFDGRELARSGESEFRTIRGTRIGYIAQDATTALNPVLRVGTQLAEVLRAHLDLDRRAATERSVDLLRSVGIPEPENRLHAYPLELSGGMRQRVAIAIALSCEPDMIIADEPTTALDVTVQAQVIELLVTAARSRRMAMILISHDLALISRAADRTLVMYAGRIVEDGRTERVIGGPRHPYTAALLESTPRVNADRTTRFPVIPGRPPDLAAVPPGCRFAPRCSYARDRCWSDEPKLTPQRPACWYPLNGHWDGPAASVEEHSSA